MLTKYLDQTVEQNPALQEQGKQLAQTVHQLVLQGGEPVRRGVDILHGTWLGHPLHPVLTDVVVGAWTLGAMFDFMALSSRSRQAEQAADTLATVGVVAALPTAASGLADFSTIPKSSAGTGLLHGLATIASLGMYLLSLYARKKGQRGRGFFWSSLGLGLITIAAYLGGHLVFGKRVGVNRNEPTNQPQEWTAVMEETALSERQPQRVEVEGKPVLFYRMEGKIYAVSAVCPHAEGPLEEGQFTGQHVQCPWHDSVFDLSDGSIVHGPSTYPLPNYETRLHNGQIEVRLVE